MTTFSFSDPGMHNAYLYETYMAIKEIRDRKELEEWSQDCVTGSGLAVGYPKTRFDVLLDQLMTRAVDEAHIAGFRKDTPGKARAEKKLAMLKRLYEQRTCTRNILLSPLTETKARISDPTQGGGNKPEKSIRRQIEKEFPEIKFPDIKTPTPPFTESEGGGYIFNE